MVCEDVELTVCRGVWRESCRLIDFAYVHLVGIDTKRVFKLHPHSYGVPSISEHSPRNIQCDVNTSDRDVLRDVIVHHLVSGSVETPMPRCAHLSVPSCFHLLNLARWSI